jgi:hypothetical protein
MGVVGDMVVVVESAIFCEKKYMVLFSVVVFIILIPLRQLRWLLLAIYKCIKVKDNRVG